MNPAAHELVPTASADDLRAAAPAARRSTAEEDYDSDDEPDLTHECFKLMVLVGLIVALVLLNKEVGAALLTMKNWLLKHIPLYAYFLGYVAVQGCRRLLPPLYYAMPIGLLTIFYLVARLGWLRAGFLQGLADARLRLVAGIRHAYTHKVALVRQSRGEDGDIYRGRRPPAARADKEEAAHFARGTPSRGVVTVALCVEIKILRRVRAESSRRPTPSTRRLLDGVAMPVPRRRPSQDGSVIGPRNDREE